MGLVGVAQTLAELQSQHFSPGSAWENSRQKRPVNAAKHREEGAFGPRPRRVSEPIDAVRRASDECEEPRGAFSEGRAWRMRPLDESPASTRPNHA
jgi:hypothetical protein